MKYISTDGEEFSTEKEYLAHEYECMYFKLLINSIDPFEFSCIGFDEEEIIEIIHINSAADVDTVNLYAKYYFDTKYYHLLTPKDIGKTILIYVKDYMYQKEIKVLGTIDEYSNYIEKKLNEALFVSERDVFKFGSYGYEYFITRPQNLQDIKIINDSIINSSKHKNTDRAMLNKFGLLLTEKDIGVPVMLENLFGGRYLSVDEIINKLYSSYNEAMEWASN